MASGSFIIDGYGYPYYNGRLKVNWAQIVDDVNKTSVVNITSLEILSTNGPYGGVAYYPTRGGVSVNSTPLTVFSGRDDYAFVVNAYNTWYALKVEGDGSYTENYSDSSSPILHQALGKLSVTISVDISFSDNRGHTLLFVGSNTVTLSPVTVYTLSVNSGTGSVISVNRTYSPSSNVGIITDGSGLYDGDKLKITAAPLENYEVLSLSVNGGYFVSGNTHTVSGDTSVISTARPLASSIGASDADIGSNTTIVVQRYSPDYRDTISYSFGDLSGTIRDKTSDTTISWAVPVSFYEQIPNEKSGICTLTCETYNNNILLGTSTFSFRVTANEQLCAPDVSGSVTDVNSSSATLTGGASLIRYKSSALCTISATARNGASIVGMTINGIPIVTGSSITINNFVSGDFTMSAVDSRGYSTSIVVTKPIIEYIVLTITPSFSRESPTSDHILMSFSGNWYSGSFGSVNNSLDLSFCYMDGNSSTYSSWYSISDDEYQSSVNKYGTGLSGVDSPIVLHDNGSTESPISFDYRLPYTFKVRIRDGASGVVLSETIQTVSVQKGVPVFDWGEHDFNFNVPVNFSDGVSGIGLNDFGLIAGVSQIQFSTSITTTYIDVPGLSSVDSFFISPCFNQINVIVNIDDSGNIVQQPITSGDVVTGTRVTVVIPELTSSGTRYVAWIAVGQKINA